MKLDFFDANLFLGKPVKEVYKPVSSAEELLKQMDGFGIRKALVWHIAQYDYSPVEGNCLLSQLIAGNDRLFGCWTILPPQTREVIDVGFFKRMKQNRIFALRAFPDPHRFILNHVTFRNFLKEISKRRIPLLLSLEKPGVSWNTIYQLLEEFPRLTCILCDIGIWAVSRYTWPLLETYPNLSLETSLLSLEEGVVEETVERFGAERLIFGTGFPVRYPESSILPLLHSPISGSDKRKIAHTNLENLFSRIRL